ncbi:MAG TPA: aspartate-semialdehyde dehydrogenase [Solirubrobacteraceae bacterium]|nr:aspartate-semialdehyde dehydrogenase [Solirubrobacteraceae bacterium]
MKIAIVGATGAVGTIMRRLAHERLGGHELVAFASDRSAGRQLDDGLICQPLNDETIAGFDLALFSAGGSTSRAWAPRFADQGAVVIDNSSAFRMEPDVPLVVSEVNPEAIDDSPRGIVANPNCTTMVAMLPAKALHDLYGMTEMVATSFQAAGGAGQKGIDELTGQIATVGADIDQLVSDGAAAAAKVTHSVHAATLAFNVVPLLGTLDDDGYTDEEMKLQNESRKILGIPGLRVTPTCVRVPVVVGHAIAVRATFEREPDIAEALAALAAFPNLVVDDLPTPLQWAGRNETAVGRVRRDLADRNAINFFVVGDNLLKGAALNTVQLAELAIARGRVGAGAAA